MSTPPFPPELTTRAQLKTLQRMMGETLFQPLGRGDGLASTGPDGSPMAKFAQRFMKPNERMSAVARLEIYARQYWYRLLDCLYDDYPGLRALLGQRKFHALSRAYLAKFPSASFTLRNLGSRLEQFLREEPQWAGLRQAMAIDLARFEWAQTLAFDEAQRTPLQGDALLGSDPTHLYLGLQPYLSLLDLDFAVDTYFLAMRQGEAGMRSASSNAHLEATEKPKLKRVALPKPGKIWLAVHRHDNQIYIKRLDREAYLLLTYLRDGQSMGSALEAALAEADPQKDWAAAVGEWFQTWGLLGWFCKPAPLKN